MKLNNHYFIIRHGEALSNTSNVISCWPEKASFPLTQKGREQVSESAKQLKNIDYIFSSDLLRTKETAGIIGKEIGIKPKYDKRLREYNFGIFNNSSIEYFEKNFGTGLERFTLKPIKGENYNQIKKRMLSLLKDLEEKYKGKNIVLVSHQVPIIMLIGAINKMSNEDIYYNYLKNNRINNGEIINV